MPGEELALAIVGVVIGGPAFASAFKTSCEYIVKRIDLIKNAPCLIAELQEKVRGLYEGRLPAFTDIAEHTFGLVSANDSLRIDIERGLKQMRAELLNIDSILDKLIDKDGKISKRKAILPPAWTWKRDAKEIIRRFDKIQNNFQLTVSLVEGRHRALSTPQPLSPANFAPYIRLDSSAYTLIESESHIWEGQAEVRDASGQPKRINVIVELDNGKPQTEIPTIASHLTKIQQEHGLLKCLGYHEAPDSAHTKPYLVFEVPEDFGNPSTLRGTMLQTPISTDEPGGGHALESRFRLAHQISESVLSVHATGFVHKNIRPDTILLLRSLSSASPSSPQTLPGVQPYLTFWMMLRKATDLSSLRGEDDWQRDIYRHPDRQGTQPQERYNIGHDIYSLGVCLLEVGLWEPLIVTKRDTDALLVDVNDSYDVTENTVCDTYRKVALKHNLVAPEDAESVKIMTRKRTVKEVLIAMARDALPQRMSTDYADIVVACLTCLEGGFGRDSASEVDFLDGAASKFKLLIVEGLARMY
jgi:hypothetical protein